LCFFVGGEGEGEGEGDGVGGQVVEAVVGLNWVCWSVGRLLGSSVRSVFVMFAAISGGLQVDDDQYPLTKLNHQLIATYLFASSVLYL